MNTAKSLFQHPYAKWCMFMFPYGVYRQWNAYLEPPIDLLGHRTALSLLNGMVYISPIGVVKLFNQIDRFDIEYHKLDKKKYEKVYEEINGYNIRAL
jgi:hypothetical protein